MPFYFLTCLFSLFFEKLKHISKFAMSLEKNAPAHNNHPSSQKTNSLFNLADQHQHQADVYTPARRVAQLWARFSTLSKIIPQPSLRTLL
jgi:hypothetical protein